MKCSKCNSELRCVGEVVEPCEKCLGKAYDKGYEHGKCNNVNYDYVHPDHKKKGKP